MAPITDEGKSDYPRTLPSASGEIRVNHDVLDSICDQLQKDLNGLEAGGAGTLAQFRRDDEGLVTAAELGRYPAAEGMGGQGGLAGTCKNAYDNIGTTYGTFLKAYENFILGLRKSATTHGEAEQANTRNANNVGNGGSPTTSNAPYAI